MAGTGRWLSTNSGAVGGGVPPLIHSESSYVLRPARLAPTRPATASKRRALGALSRKPPNTWLGVSPSKYQSNSVVASPRPRPAPGSRPVMYPSTDTDRALNTLLISATFLGSFKRLHDRSNLSSLREPKVLNWPHAAHQLR